MGHMWLHFLTIFVAGWLNIFFFWKVLLPSAFVLISTFDLISEWDKNDHSKPEIKISQPGCQIKEIWALKKS